MSLHAASKLAVESKPAPAASKPAAVANPAAAQSKSTSAACQACLSSYIMAEPVLDFQAKYEELMRSREEEAPTSQGRANPRATARYC